jgi:hypothetical protein
MNPGQTVWYVDMEGRANPPQALRLLGEVSVPHSKAWLAERINGNMLNVSTLLLLSRGPVNEQPDTELIPVSIYDGGRLKVGESVPEHLVRALQVLDVAGIAPSREIAEYWSRK